MQAAAVLSGSLFMVHSIQTTRKNVGRFEVVVQKRPNAYENMSQLIKLLLRERWRKLELQYGWASRLSVSLLSLMGAWVVAATLSGFLAVSSVHQVAVTSNRLLGVWIIAGILIAKDLTWHARLDRLIFFQLSFAQLYASTLLLGLLNYPLVLGLCILAAATLKNGAGPAVFAGALVGFCLLALIVRLTVSLVRTGLYRSSALNKRVTVLLWTAVALAATLAVLPLFGYDSSGLLPGSAYASVLHSIDPFIHLLQIAVAVPVLAFVDYLVQFEVVYSGTTGPSPLRVTRLSRGRFLLLPGSPSSVLWRIGLLGWLRNRNALLLLIWGGLYGFGYTYFTNSQGQLYYIAFCWMVLIFHGYLRGNLLGIDNRSAWLYYTLAVPVETAIRAKNSALSFLQMLMVAGVLLPPVLRRTPGMTTTVEWVGILSFACCGVLLGEIFGSVFSLLHPEPIERGVLYSGGTTPGAIMVPVLQTLVLAILIVPASLVRRSMGTIQAVALLSSAPVLLWVARTVLLRSWVRNRMIVGRETILQKLMGT